jgi:hypothetical protein
MVIALFDLFLFCWLRILKAGSITTIDNIITLKLAQHICQIFGLI